MYVAESVSQSNTMAKPYCASAKIFGMLHSTSATNVRSNVTLEKGDTSTGPTNSSASARRAPAAPGVVRHAPGARSFGHAAMRNGAMKAMSNVLFVLCAIVLLITALEEYVFPNSL